MARVFFIHSLIHGYMHAFIQQRMTKCSLDAMIIKY